MRRGRRSYHKGAMHRGIAQAIPNTPEARAIFAGDIVKEATFGDVVTAFMECGLVDDPTDYESIRQETTSYLGLAEGEFDRRLQQPGLLDEHNAYHFERSALKELERRLSAQKAAEVLPVLVEQAFGIAGNTNQSHLEEVLQREEDWLEELNREIVDETVPRSLRVLKETIVRPRAEARLNALRQSRFVISVYDLMTMMRENPILTELGEVGVTGVVYGFGHELSSRGAYIGGGDFGDYYFAKEWIDESVERDFMTKFVSEADLATLALLVGQHYYEVHSPGHDIIEAKLKPLVDRLFVTRERRTEFEQAYPLAN